MLILRHFLAKNNQYFMQKYIRILGLALVLSFFVSCSATRVVKPLKAKEVAVGLDLGGPMIQFGAPIPIPLTSISAAYGIDSMMSVFGGLHTTALAFGNLQMDFGIVRDLLPAKGRRPGISVAPVVNMLIPFSTGEFRLYPELDINVHWQYSLKRRNFLYFSFASWFDLWAKKAHAVPNTTRYVPTFALGHTFENKKMRCALELRVIAPFTKNNVIVDYIGLGDNGAFGFYFSVNRKF